MHSRFILLAGAPALIAAPAHAEVYLTVAQAQAALLGRAAITPDDRVLTPEQAHAIKQRTGVDVLSRTVHSWRAANGSRLFVDKVVGKHDFITLALALDPHGAVSGLEIMEYRETYGGQVRAPAWRAQFVGKRDGAPFRLDQDIRNNSGGTLSARHVTDGVKRLLATNAIVFAGR